MTVARGALKRSCLAAVLCVCLLKTSQADVYSSFLEPDSEAWPGVDLWTTLLHTVQEYSEQQERRTDRTTHSVGLRTRMELDAESDVVSSDGLVDGGPTERDRAIGAALGPYITPIASPNISKACHQASQAYMNNILRKEWAMKMFDATGKLPDGILEGNINMFGNWDECLNVTAVLNATDIGGEDPVIPGFTGKYCLTYITKFMKGGEVFRANALPRPNNFGLVPILPFIAGKFTVMESICMPSVCTAKELSDALQDRFIAKGLYLTVDKDGCYTKDKTTGLTSGAIVMIFIMVLCGALMLVGTFIDVVDTYAIQAPGSFWSSVNNMVNRCSTSTLRRVFRSFSMYTNGRKLLDTSATGDTLNCLHGIRFLSNTWVILGHTYVFLLYGKHRNITTAYSWFESVAFEAVANATVSVDSFFFLSGLLVSYGVMRQLERTRGKFNIVMFYVHRYIRLTPVMMLVIGFIATLYSYLGSGPTWSTIDTYGNPAICRDNWWKNMLYINNLVDVDRQCLGQTWYLANDMQMFWFSPLVLLPLWYWPMFGQLWLIFLVCFFTGINAMVTAVHDIGMPDGDDQNLRYMKPWCRAGAYLVGIYTGWILYKIRGKKIHIPSPVVAIGWIVSALTACLIIYGIYGLPQPPPRSENIIYAMLNRTAWTMCLAWVVFACVTGYGGIINDILSWKAFISLSRLTYTSYLVHIDIQVYFWNTNKMPNYLDQTFVVYNFLGSLPIIFAVSTLFSLAFESPMIALEKIIFPQTRSTKPVPKPRTEEPVLNQVELKRGGEDNAGLFGDAMGNNQVLVEAKANPPTTA